MLNILKSIVRKTLHFWGVEVRRTAPRVKQNAPYSAVQSRTPRVLDLEGVACIGSAVPGMITDRAGELLFSLSYSQLDKGDVVEIGSWQGRSTIYLALGAREAVNGTVYAIDHFKGNPSKERRYRVKDEGLRDLKEKFLENINRAGLKDSVELLDMTSREASARLKNVEIRLLFIDGNHEEEAVREDLSYFIANVVKGGYVVFDDYSEGFRGVVNVVDEFIEQYRPRRCFAYRNMFIGRL